MGLVLKWAKRCTEREEFGYAQACFLIGASLPLG